MLSFHTTKHKHFFSVINKTMHELEHLMKTSDKTLLVLFYGDYCGFCHRLMKHDWRPLQQHFAKDVALMLETSSPDVLNMLAALGGGREGVPQIFRIRDAEVRTRVVGSQDLGDLIRALEF